MTKIVSLADRKAEVDADLVAYVEDMLESVKAGEVVALATATVSRDGSIGTGWKISETHRVLHPLLGSVARLEYRLAREIDHLPDEPI